MYIFTIIITFIALFLFIENRKLQNKVNNRDIPEIIKIEQEKHQKQQEKDNLAIAKLIKEGSYSFKISDETFNQINHKLTGKTIYIKYEYPNLIFSDKMREYKIKHPEKTKNVKSCFYHSLLDFDTTITKRINKKEFINDLKAIPTPLVNISFSYNDSQILISEPQGRKYICHISKD